MFSAGRVLLMPKGAYNPLTTYEMLDIVSYNGSSYIAKGTTTGNLPTDTTYWQLSAYGGQAANMAGNFAELETSSVASAIHYENDIFVDENSQLMKATQTINIGDTIDENVNCTPTTVEALISYLSSYVDSLDSLNRKIQGAIEIAVQTDLHSLAIGEYYKKQTTFYVTNAPTGINQEASATFRLTVEAALDNASQASSPLLLTLRTPDGVVYTQGFDGSAWGSWLDSINQTLTNQVKDVYEVMGQNGAKNAFPLDLEAIKNTSGNTGGTWSGDAYTINGITYTFNGDGTITGNGTASAAARIMLISDNGGGKSPCFLKPDTDYILSCENIMSLGGTGAIFSINEWDGTQYVSGLTVGGYTGKNEWEYTTKSSAIVKSMRALLEVKSGVTLDNFVFKPMVRDARDIDPTFQPYAKTNQQLTEDTTALLDNTEVNGAVNMLPNNATSQVVNGITFTVNDNGTVKVSGTGDAEGLNPYLQISQFTLPKGTYKFSGCPINQSVNTAWLFLRTTSGTLVGNDLGDGFVFTVSDETVRYEVRLYVFKAATDLNLVFKPMISLASLNLSYDDYVPFAKSNRELTEDVEELNTLSELTDASQITVADSSILEVTAVRLNKKGSVLNGFLVIQVKSALPFNRSLLTLPSGFRPSAVSNSIGIEQSVAQANCGMFGIWPTGDMQLQIGFANFTGNMRIAINAII